MKPRWAAVCLGLLVGLPLPAQAPKLGPPEEDAPKRVPRGPKLELSDGKLPVWELRPLDRRVYAISLDGVWKGPPAEGASYQLKVCFPDGQAYSHRPINDALFFRGEMRFLVPQYMLVRTRTSRGGTLRLYVTERPTAGARPVVISNTVEVPWPPKRPVVRRPPATRATPARPIDAPPLPEPEE